MASDELVLAGVTVVELAGDVGGEMLGKLLAEMGATLVKVEPPEGSPTRAIGPWAGGRNDRDHSLTFWYYNTNKRSVVVDYRTAEGRDELARLAAGADVFISTLAPPELRSLGLELESLRAGAPELIIMALTPFGLTGPRADWVSSDLVGLALGSPLNSCGYDDHSIPPIRPGGDQGYQSATSFALMASMLALIDRQRTGRGQLVDVGMHDCLAVSAELANPYWFYPRVVVRPRGRPGAPGRPPGPRSLPRGAPVRSVSCGPFAACPSRCPPSGGGSARPGPGAAPSGAQCGGGAGHRGERRCHF